MSMTQEQALKLLEHPIYKWSMDWDEREDGLDYTEAIEIAIAALRPVSREQVEKVWRGKWNNINPAVLKPGVSWVCRCAKCGCPQDYKHNFCPNCGAAQTDEAVQMVMERLEKLKNEIG